MAENKEETKKKQTGYVATERFKDAYVKGVTYEKGDQIQGKMTDATLKDRLNRKLIKEA